MTWVESYIANSGRRHPPISGLDVDAYDGAEWEPTPSWVRSACESGVSILAAVDRSTLSAGAARAWSGLDAAYTRLHAVRARAVARAQRQVRAGDVPRVPPALRRAQTAERRAFLKFCRAAGIQTSGGCPVGGEPATPT